MITIEKPEITGCYNHDSGFKDDCELCKELKRKRMKAFKEQLNAISYKIVFDNWKLYLNKFLPKEFKGGTGTKRATYQACVDRAKIELTKDMYPFHKKTTQWKTSWNNAMNELSLKLEDSFIPQIQNEDLDRKENLWF